MDDKRFLRHRRLCQLGMAVSAAMFLFFVGLGTLLVLDRMAPPIVLSGDLVASCPGGRMYLRCVAACNGRNQAEGCAPW